MIETTYVINLIFVGLVSFAAFTDAMTFKISNGNCLAILVTFPLATLFALEPVDFTSHVLAALFVFAVGLVLFQMKWFGGGDVKLLTAISFWFEIGDLPFLITSIALTGAALGILIGLSRVAWRFVQPYLKRSAASGNQEPVYPALQEGGPIPYGVAIAIGTLFVLLTQ